MTTHGAVAERVGERSGVRPYAPSWLDSLVGWIERVPGPAWLPFSVIAVFILAFIALEAALSSRGLFGQQPAYFGYALIHFYPLAAYYYVSRGARSSWDAFRPATDFDDDHAQRMQLELSTTPARPVAVITVIAALSYGALMLALPEGLDLVGHPPSFVVLRVISETLWFAPVAAIVAYFLFRQLRIVSRLHRSVVNLDLLEPAPLHAMANLTARSAFVLLIFQLVAFLPLPNLSETARLAVIFITAPFLVLTAAAFFVPLRGLHALLDAERRRLHSDVSARISSTIATLHRAVDEETAGPRDADAWRVDQNRADALTKTLASLLQERDFVSRLSTWPWDPSTLRAVLSAVALPIVLFLLTRVLERFGV